MVGIGVRHIVSQEIERVDLVVLRDIVLVISQSRFCLGDECRGINLTVLTLFQFEVGQDSDGTDFGFVDQVVVGESITRTECFQKKRETAGTRSSEDTRNDEYLVAFLK